MLPVILIQPPIILILLSGRESLFGYYKKSEGLNFIIFSLRLWAGSVIQVGAVYHCNAIVVWLRPSLMDCLGPAVDSV